MLKQIVNYIKAPIQLSVSATKSGSKDQMFDTRDVTTEWAWLSTQKFSFCFYSYYGGMVMIILNIRTIMYLIAYFQAFLKFHSKKGITVAAAQFVL